MIDRMVLTHVRKITYSPKLQGLARILSIVIVTAVYFPFSNAFKIPTLPLLSQVVVRCSPLGNCKLG